MFPPELESIADELTKRYEVFLQHDGEGSGGMAVPELLTAEEQVKDFVYKLGQSMLQAFVDVRLRQAKGNRQPCTCGRIPSVHSNTRWTRQTPFGPIWVRDPYVYCPVCHDSDRPLHALLGTERETWSLIVEQAAVDLASDESCGKAVAKLERHHPGVEMHRTTALRMLHEHGHKARAFIDEKLADARTVAEQPPALRLEGVEEFEVQFDGGMIPVRRPGRGFRASRGQSAATGRRSLRRGPGLRMSGSEFGMNRAQLHPTIRDGTVGLR